MISFLNPGQRRTPSRLVRSLRSAAVPAIAEARRTDRLLAAIATGPSLMSAVRLNATGPK